MRDRNEISRGLSSESEELAPPAAMVMIEVLFDIRDLLVGINNNFSRQIQIANDEYIIRHGL